MLFIYKFIYKIIRAFSYAIKVLLYLAAKRVGVIENTIDVYYDMNWINLHAI